jgi:hypothetical protein
MYLCAYLCMYVHMYLVHVRCSTRVCVFALNVLRLHFNRSKTEVVHFTSVAEMRCDMTEHEMATDQQFTVERRGETYRAFKVCQFNGSKYICM